MRARIIALGLTFMASMAQADIAWNVDRIGAGSTMVMSDRAGELTHVKRGTQGALHVFDVFAGQGGAGGFAGSYKTNARGDVVETVAFDGAVTRFVPHRCNRTVGQCNFTVVHPDGFTEPRTRVTTEVNGGLQYREYGLDGLMTEGALHLDANGTSKGGWQRQKNADEKKRRHRRIVLALK
ncbi:hypothetical protein [Sagittula sp. SSi028]|uniref:hypothetical protein n=1 Tax=Sagittula sp. SSi028 TaxID=3400636 RepID=UPI003AF9B5C5